MGIRPSILMAMRSTSGNRLLSAYTRPRLNRAIQPSQLGHPDQATAPFLPSHG